MAITKQYLKSKPVCKVTFKLPKEVVGDANKVSVVGNFNDWDLDKDPMKKVKKDGSFSLALNFDKDQEVSFRYYIDGERWENDPDADRFVVSEFGDSENCVLVL